MAVGGVGTMLSVSDAPSLILQREQLSPSCGCLAKLGGVELDRVLDLALGSARPDGGTPEDCATLKFDGGTVLASWDFRPLVGRDVHRAGRILAFHAMSEIYAMGTKPRFALALVIADSELPERAISSVIGRRERPVERAGRRDVSLESRPTERREAMGQTALTEPQRAVLRPATRGPGAEPKVANNGRGRPPEAPKRTAAFLPDRPGRWGLRNVGFDADGRPIWKFDYEPGA